MWCTFKSATSRLTCTKLQGVDVDMWLCTRAICLPDLRIQCVTLLPGLSALHSVRMSVALQPLSWLYAIDMPDADEPLPRCALRQSSVECTLLDSTYPLPAPPLESSKECLPPIKVECWLVDAAATTPKREPIQKRSRSHIEATNDLDGHHRAGLGRLAVAARTRIARERAWSMV